MALLRNSHVVATRASRLAVQKTYKLYIGGKFVRSESGRVDITRGVNYSRASRKDFRDAVLAARKAQSGWAKQSAYLRGQILYRAAEMLERRRAELETELASSNGTKKSRLPNQPSRGSGSAGETTLAIDRLVHYAGWTDKFSQVFSAVNPVASSHFNFVMPEPTGVVVALCPDQPPLVALVSLVAPIILAGNSVVVLASSTDPLPALTFSEIMATSDLPGGVMNILAGDRAELAPHFASHMDVNAIVDASGDAKVGEVLQGGGHFNVKRYVRRDLTPAQWRSDDGENPYWILDTVEMKTAWHPIGL